MNWVQSLTKAIDYIESHLTDDISIEEISRQSYASSSHFQILFHVVMGLPVGEYIRNRRLSLAAQDLQQGGKIMDVAMRYYMEEVFNAAGADFIFFNGAVNAIYPERQRTPDKGWNEDYEAYWEDYNNSLDWQARRMGRDFAGIALAMTMPPEKITGNELTNPDNDHGWEYRRIAAMMQTHGTVSETELPPRLDIRLRELQLDIENPFVRWAAKRGMMNYIMLRGETKQQLRLATEIGYMELGGAVTVALLPGEFTPGLAWGGGSATAEYAIRQRAFGHPTFSESAGREVLVFGLCNDEIGYVIPDNDYLMFHNPFRDMNYMLLRAWEYDHYQELLSPGPRTGSALTEAFAGLVIHG